MPSDIEFNHLPEPGGIHGHSGPVDLSRLTDVSVELTVEVGRTRMSLGDALSLGPGSVVPLDRLADRPVDLLVNGRTIAHGEVVVIDEQFGLRITEVVGAELPGEIPGGAIVAAPVPLDAAPPVAELPPLADAA